MRTVAADEQHRFVQPEGRPLYGLRWDGTDLKVKARVVNVVDLMTLFPREFHPHGMDETRFVELVTADKPVVFAFPGYKIAPSP